MDNDVLSSATLVFPFTVTPEGSFRDVSPLFCSSPFEMRCDGAAGELVMPLAQL